VTAVRALRGVAGTPAWQVLTVSAAAALVLLIAAYFVASARRARTARTDEPEIPMAGSGHPVPPADLVVPPAPPRQRTGELTGQQGQNGPSATKEEAPHGSA